MTDQLVDSHLYFQGWTKDMVWCTWWNGRAVWGGYEECCPRTVPCTTRFAPSASHNHEPKHSYESRCRKRHNFMLLKFALILVSLRFFLYIFLHYWYVTFILITIAHTSFMCRCANSTIGSACRRVCHHFSQVIPCWLQSGLQLCWSCKLCPTRLGKHSFYLNILIIIFFPSVISWNVGPTNMMKLIFRNISCNHSSLDLYLWTYLYIFHQTRRSILESLVLAHYLS